MLLMRYWQPLKVDHGLRDSGVGINDVDVINPSPKIKDYKIVCLHETLFKKTCNAHLE